MEALTFWRLNLRIKSSNFNANLNKLSLQGQKRFVHQRLFDFNVA